MNKNSIQRNLDFIGREVNVQKYDFWRLFQEKVASKVSKRF